MLSFFYPDELISSVYDVDYELLYKEGCRGVLFDIDNTLVPHDAGADIRSRALFTDLKTLGIKACLISNNKRERVEGFARELGAEHYIYDSHKPSRQAYLRASELLGEEPSALVFFGDQLFTDVLGAKNAGIRSIMVHPIAGEKLLRIKLKRILEQPILAAYRKSEKTANRASRLPLINKN